MRLLFFSERVRPPFDEGIKNVARHLILEWRREHELLALTSEGQDVPELGLRDITVNRLLISPALTRAIWDFRPQAVFYLPTAAATPASFIRAAVLRYYACGASTALIALQSRFVPHWARPVMRSFRPDVVLGQSELTLNTLRQLGCRVAFLPGGVDLERFRPASPEEKIHLRRCYGLPEELCIILHVGHLNPYRLSSDLIAAAKLPGLQLLVVGSTSSPQDSAVVQELRDAGARVITNYVLGIEEMYQLADGYLFVAAPGRAIDIPLSVLEALACNLPVVSFPFGGLPLQFPPGVDGLQYVNTSEELRKALLRICENKQFQSRRLVENYPWATVAKTALAALENQR